MGRTSERQEINAPLICETLSVLSGKLGPTYFDSAERLKAQTLIHKQRGTLAQSGGADIVSVDRIIYVAHAPGTLVEFAVFVQDKPAGGDKQYTVDLQKSTGGSAFATVLSAVVTIDSSKADLTRYLATLSAGVAYQAGDAFAIIYTASGSTGSQGQGACAVATFYEDGEA